MGGYRPLLNEENDSDLNFKTNNNERSIQSINKKGLKISIDDLKKYKKLVNKKTNYNKIINKKTNNKIIIKKNISNLKEDYSSYDTFKKSKQKINTVILNNRFNNKTELDLFNVGNKKLALKNIKKNSILKKLMKDKKIGKQKEQKIKYNQINKTTLSNTNNNDYKCQSLKKIENFQDYYEQKTLSNIPLKNIHKIHRMITEEKNKALNKLNVNILKYKDKKNLNQLYSQIKNKAIISNKNNLIDGEKAQTYNKNE
jgi:anion-transporting  ArsA/GET3 family ATPase